MNTLLKASDRKKPAPQKKPRTGVKLEKPKSTLELALEEKKSFRKKKILTDFTTKTREEREREATEKTSEKISNALTQIITKFGDKLSASNLAMIERVDKRLKPFLKAVKLDPNQLELIGEKLKHFEIVTKELRDAETELEELRNRKIPAVRNIKATLLMVKYLEKKLKIATEELNDFSNDVENKRKIEEKSIKGSLGLTAAAMSFYAKDLADGVITEKDLDVVYNRLSDRANPLNILDRSILLDGLMRNKDEKSRKHEISDGTFKSLQALIDPTGEVEANYKTLLSKPTKHVIKKMAEMKSKAIPSYIPYKQKHPEPSLLSSSIDLNNLEDYDVIEESKKIQQALNQAEFLGEIPDVPAVLGEIAKLENDKIALLTPDDEAKISEIEGEGKYKKGSAIKHVFSARGIPESEQKVFLTKTGLFKKRANGDKFMKLPSTTKNLIKAVHDYEKTYPHRKISIKLLEKNKVI